MTALGSPHSVGDEVSAPGDRDAPDEPAHRISRRSVIGGLAASGLMAGLIGSLVAACSDGSSSPPSPATEAPATEAEQAEAAIVRIGRRYRADHPDEDDREVLLERLGVRSGAAGSSDVLSSLDAQVSDDYGAGRTVWVDGWVLSVTEGRAAALVSLA